MVQMALPTDTVMVRPILVAKTIVDTSVKCDLSAIKWVRSRETL